MNASIKNKKPTKKQSEMLEKVNVLIGFDLSHCAYFLRRNVIGLDMQFDSLPLEKIRLKIERAGLEYKLFSVSENGYKRIALRLI